MVRQQNVRGCLRGQAHAIAAKARIRKINEDRITAAAVSSFAKKGEHCTTIAEIAASLCMPTATAHYYVKNKNDLYDPVLLQIVQLLYSNVPTIKMRVYPLALLEKLVQS